LDEDKRLVFVLKELQHLSYKEISEITGAGVPKLKTDLHRAKIEMRRVPAPVSGGENMNFCEKYSGSIEDLIEGELTNKKPGGWNRTFLNARNAGSNTKRCGGKRKFTRIICSTPSRRKICGRISRRGSRRKKKKPRISPPICPRTIPAGE
jgi:hypothetical protein